MPLPHPATNVQIVKRGRKVPEEIKFSPRSPPPPLRFPGVQFIQFNSPLTI